MASGLVKALEGVWLAVQDHHPDVPTVVVTLGAASVGVPRGVLKLGHFAANRWTPGDADSTSIAELFIGGEGLAQGAESVLATLLHEAAHGVADVRQAKTSPARAATTTLVTSRPRRRRRRTSRPSAT